MSKKAWVILGLIIAFCFSGFVWYALFQLIQLMIHHG